MRPRTWAPLVALLVFLFACGWSFRDLVGQDLSRATPLPTVLLYDVLSPDSGKVMRLSQGLDQRFVIWAIARNARTWLRAPLDLFDAETCFPAPKSLALGEPMPTLGLLGTPAWLLTGDPVATYNFVVMVLPILSALAMFWLVRRWTGSDAAGIVAGVVYAFHVVKISNIAHPYAADTAWTVFAVVFFERWLERGRWWDVAGLALATALQIGGSIYPLLGAAVVGSVLGLHAVSRFGLRRTRPLQWIVLLAAVGLVTYAAFAPFLAKSEAGEMPARSLQIFLAWEGLLPGASGFPGLVLLLSGAAAFLPKRAEGGASSLQWPLLICIVITLWIATGGNMGDRFVAEMRGEPVPSPWPNLYVWLGAIVPGLAEVRAPLAIGGVTHTVMAALAGIGVARLLERAPERYVLHAGVAAVAVATLYTLGIGTSDAHTFAWADTRPRSALLNFWSELDALGNTGPVLELPVDDLGPGYGSMSVMLSAYHHRRTSRCYNSFVPKEVKQTTVWAKRLPEAEAIDVLAASGFTTVLVHHPRGRRDMRETLARIDEAASAPGARLRRIHRDPVRSAYEIVAPGATRP